MIGLFIENRRTGSEQSMEENCWPDSPYLLKTDQDPCQTSPSAKGDSPLSPCQASMAGKAEEITSWVKLGREAGRRVGLPDILISNACKS